MVVHYVDDFDILMIAENVLMLFVEKKEGNASKSSKDLQMIKLADKNSGQLVGSEKVIYSRRWTILH